MGQINGKQFQINNQDYFQQQIELYRWRADKEHNKHIPRVYFSSKLALINRSKLQNLLQEQLATHNYVDINSISNLTVQKQSECQQEVMSFENYHFTLASFEHKLFIEETLFVLQTLLIGYETILHKMHRVFVSSNCCFVTEKGDVRAWINPNHTLNQFPLNCSYETSEPPIINLILTICNNLNIDIKAFRHFHEHLNRFMGNDILHNINFSSIRKFINGYLYTQHLKLPNNLRLRIETIRQNGRSTSFQSTSSLSQLVESPISHSQQESRVTNLTKSESNSISRLSLSSTPSNNLSGKQFQFYQPNQKPVKKLSSLEPQYNQGFLNRSEILLKNSVQASISTSFNKKKPLHQQNLTFTPKNQIRTRCHLESTTGESFVQHFKTPSALVASKLLQSSSASNQMENTNSRARLERVIQNCSGYLASDPSTKDIHKMETKTHSKQPSFDQNSSTMFLTPPNNFPQRAQFRSKIDTVSESEQAQEEQSQLGPASTTGQIYPSQMLHRQVSGLVSNEELHMCESQGSFISVDNSNASEYHGELLRLGRSAKMLAVPSNRRIQAYMRSTVRHPHPTR